MNTLTEVLIGILVIVAVAAGAEHVGHTSGVRDQKVVDQVEFDKINKQLTTQKAEANELYRQAQADIIKLQAERDELKGKLEVKREADRKATDDNRNRFSGMGLRLGVLKGAGDRADGGGTQGAGSNAASVAAPTPVDVPKETASDLRQLAFDADKLADDYRLCYGYATQVK